MGTEFREQLFEKMDGAVEKALQSLAGYKFWTFGYHAARWVQLNQLLPREERRPNPFRPLVLMARERLNGLQPQVEGESNG